MPTRAPVLLIIDDQPISITTLGPFLRERGFEVLWAQSGKEGLKLARHHLPHLVLLDTVMPDMDGFAICRQLKADSHTAAIPVIFLAASTTLEHKLQGFSLGCVDYIAKPFVSEEVLARIVLHLQIRQRLACLEAMAGQRALEGLSSERSSRNEREEQIFQAATALLDEHRINPPGLVELAHQLGTNERKLNEIFHQRVGMPVFDYLCELRLETGRQLLKGTAMQIQVIADRVGYQNAGDFSRAFRRRYQMTPREYRRACADRQDDEGPVALVD